MSSPRTPDDPPRDPPRDPTRDPKLPTDRVALLEQHLQAVAAQVHLDSHVNAPASVQARQRQQHHIRVQQRRRTRSRLMVGSVLGVAAATAIVTAGTHDWSGTVSTTAVPAASGPAASGSAASSTNPSGATAGPTEGTASCLSGVSQPSWQPAIVASSTVECPPGSAGSTAGATSTGDTGNVATLIEYKLSGAANQESLSSDPTVVSPTGQAETDITFISYPVADYLDPIDRGDSVEGITVSTVRLSSGFDARLSQGSNGYGAVRVAWTDRKHSYLLLTTNYKTASGTSGPTVDDMIRMAGSVPAAR